MTRVLLILILILLTSLGCLYLDNKLLEKKLSRAQDYKSLYEGQVEKNKIWVDELNHWRNKAQAAEVSVSTLKALADKGDPEITKIREEFKEVKKSFKNLESFSTIETSTTSEVKGIVHDTIIKEVQGADTVSLKEQIITASNAWNTYIISIGPDSNTAVVHREGKEEFDAAVFWQRLNKKGNKTIWPFGKKVWSSEMVSKNPETKIVKLSSLIVKKKK